MWPHSDARLTGGPHGMPPAMVRTIQRDRLLKAACAVVARKGYAGATVRDLLAESRVSRRTYYELYTDKEDCYLDAFNEIAEALERLVEMAFEEGPSPQERTRGGVEAIARFCLEHPTEACAALVESLAAGRSGREARNALVERLALLFAPAIGELRDSVASPELLARATVGGVFELLYGPLARHNVERLRELVDQIGELPLVPTA